jgi:hypothetical protein
MPCLSHGQYVQDNTRALFKEKGKIKLAEHGIFTLSLGTLIGTSTYYIHSKADKEQLTPPIIGGITFSYTMTVGLYIISFDRKPQVYSKSKHPRWL